MITIKEKILKFYLDVSDAYEVNLAAMKVNVKDWENLFRSFTFLFKKYQSSLLQNLVKKLNQNGIPNPNNIRACSFAKALYDLYIDMSTNKEEQSLPVSSAKKSESTPMTSGRTQTSKMSSTGRTNKDFEQMISEEKQDLLKDSLQQARGAHKENEAQSKVKGIIENSSKNSNNHDALFKEIEQLDGLLYTEGREKRARQNLQDSLMEKIHTNSDDFDNLLNDVQQMAVVYEKMSNSIIFANKNQERSQVKTALSFQKNARSQISKMLIILKNTKTSIKKL